MKNTHKTAAKAGRKDSEEISVLLTRKEIDYIAGAFCNGVMANMPNEVSAKIRDEDDARAVVNAWRKYSKHSAEFDEDDEDDRASDFEVGFIEKLETANRRRANGLVAVTAVFTSAQYARLQGAAKLLGNRITVEELIVAGALGGLDFNCDWERDTVQVLRDSVEAYARDRMAFEEAKYGTHPLQSIDYQSGYSEAKEVAS